LVTVVSGIERRDHQSRRHQAHAMIDSMIGRYQGFRALGALVIAAVEWVVTRLRERAYARISGRYYAFRGTPIDVHEEATGARWLAVEDLRRTLPGLPRDALLRQLYRQRVREDGKPRRLRIEASALEELLQKAQDQASIRFLQWLRRTVIFPAQNKARRARSGA
jgi:predicted nucleic acid-binding protein